MPLPSLFLRLSVQHLGHRPIRTLLLVLAVAVGSGAAFAASVLRQAIQESMTVSMNRMGADLMVVPRDAAVNVAAALLTVEPTDRTIDAATTDSLARLPGVDLAAPQRYFALPSADLHDNQELIAFDPAHDFTVIPWVVEKLDRPLRRGDVIVGGRRPEALGGTVPLFGRTFPVYGRLALTGVGPFERAYFVSFETASDIAAAARETTGKDVFDASRDRVSAVLLRLKVGAAPQQIQFAATGLPEVQIVAGNGLTTSVRQTLTTVLGGAVVFSVLILSTTVIMVGAMYTGLLAERRRELGLLLAVGMRPAEVVRLVLVEATLTTGLGGFCGVLLGAGGLMLFERSIGFAFASHQVPFAWPEASALLEMGLAGVVSCGGVGLVGALLPVLQAVRCEPFALVRGEGA